MVWHILYFFNNTVECDYTELITSVGSKGNIFGSPYAHKTTRIHFFHRIAMNLRVRFYAELKMNCMPSSANVLWEFTRIHVVYLLNYFQTKFVVSFSFSFIFAERYFWKCYIKYRVQITGKNRQIHNCEALGSPSLRLQWCHYGQVCVTSGIHMSSCHPRVCAQLQCVCFFIINGYTCDRIWNVDGCNYLSIIHLPHPSPASHLSQELYLPSSYLPPTFTHNSSPFPFLRLNPGCSRPHRK